MPKIINWVKEHLCLVDIFVISMFVCFFSFLFAIGSMDKSNITGLIEHKTTEQTYRGNKYLFSVNFGKFGNKEVQTTFTTYHMFNIGDSVVFSKAEPALLDLRTPPPIQLMFTNIFVISFLIMIISFSLVIHQNHVEEL